ncbi:MAG: hypothetical protein HQL62_09120 [Magnetococcales bacterium]|nr:hypothetical protein [Magnetococcales bacterium]
MSKIFNELHKTKSVQTDSDSDTTRLSGAERSRFGGLLHGLTQLFWLFIGVVVPAIAVFFFFGPHMMPSNLTEKLPTSVPDHSSPPEPPPQGAAKSPTTTPDHPSLPPERPSQGAAKSPTTTPDHPSLPPERPSQGAAKSPTTTPDHPSSPPEPPPQGAAKSPTTTPDHPSLPPERPSQGAAKSPTTTPDQPSLPPKPLSQNQQPGSGAIPSPPTPGVKTVAPPPRDRDFITLGSLSVAGKPHVAPLPEPWNTESAQPLSRKSRLAASAEKPAAQRPGHFLVLIGTYATPETMARSRRLVLSAGYPVRMRIDNTSPKLVHLNVGPFPSRKDARKVASLIRKKTGLPATDLQAPHYLTK